MIHATTRMQLVGRETELAALDAALDAMSAGRASLLAVSGEPGIGKTALLRELGGRADERGFTVAFGSATEFEQDIPFWLVIDALDERLAREPARRLDTLGDGWLGELAAAFPSLAGRRAAGRPELPSERHLLHAAARHLLELLAEHRPLAIVLDDVHWADQASLELISHVIRRRPAAPVLIALGFRPGQLVPRLANVLTAAMREGAASELMLGGLSAGEAGELLGARIPAARRRALYEESGGNPFYLIELARAEWAGAAHGALGGTPAGRVPPAVAATLQAELRRLSPNGVALLRSAALVGDPFDLDLTAEVADLDPDRALRALEELVEGELVAGDAMPRRFRFRHPIVRRAVAESVSKRFALKAHARAATALERAGAPLSARARHVEHSASAGDETAIQLLEDAGRESAARAPDAAARWFAAALRLLPHEARDRRLGLLVPYATALAATGRLDESRDAMLEALDLVPREHALVRARIVGLVAAADHMRGDPGAARAEVTRALEQLGPQDLAAACALRLELVVDHWRRAEWERMAHAAHQELERAQLLDWPQLRAQAAALAALGDYYMGQVERARERLAEAERSLATLSETELAGCVQALLFIGQARFGMERYDLAAGALERGLEIARATAQEFWLLALTAALAFAEIFRGRLRAAAELADSAVEAATLLANYQLLARAYSMRCWALTQLGELDEAVVCGERACEALDNAPASAFAWLPYCSLGAALLEHGEPERAVATIVDNTGGNELTGVDPGFRSHWYTVLARAELASHRVEAAEAWLARAEELVVRFPYAGRAAELCLPRAEIHLARGRFDEAAAAADDAVAGYRHRRTPVEVGRSLVVAARAHAMAERREEARTRLLEARELLAVSGAKLYLQAAEQELESSSARDDPSVLARLSSREREVADLVAAGKSNRELAAGLVISEKTVERHLSRIFAKLGISARAALAAAVERERRRAPGSE